MIQNNSKVYALIPARSGSKGVPNKNIMELAGYPLIAYSILAAKKCLGIDRVIVSTDSEEYAEIAFEYGAEVPFIRPVEISGDNATDIQFFQHAVDWLRREEGFAPSYFAHLRPTSPIRRPEIISQAIEEFKSNKFSALRSVHKMSNTAYKTFEIENEKLKKLCDGEFDIENTTMPRQVFPNTYCPNGYIDIVRTSMIDKGVLHGNCVKAFITKPSYDIDEIDDFALLKFMVDKNQEIIKILFDK